MTNLETYECRVGERVHTIRYRPETTDENVLRQVWQSKEYDLSWLKIWPEIWGLYEEIVEDGKRPLILDGGAHIGLSAVWFALTFPDAWIEALEPETENFNLLWANTAGHGLRVVPLGMGLGPAMGPLTIVDPGEGNWGYRARPDIDGSVVGVTVGHMLDAKPLGYVPFIVKLDIEGAEAEVLDREWLDRTPVLIVELHGWVEDKTRFELVFQGRETFHCGENIVSVRRKLL